MVFPFHAVTSRWFSETLGTPTDVQTRSWPSIAAGEHVLVTAPTGTGKTLAAFLVALDRLLTGTWPNGGLRVLYLSPLKALNNDIQRNLLVPLRDLTQRFEASEGRPPSVRVMVRSGDTPERERRQLRQNPPEILITTPESLNILLTQKSAGGLFQGLQLVIVDEVHALIGSKRGTSLLIALERLVTLAGEYQRVGLSATVNPPELVSRVLGGFRLGGEARRVSLIACPSTKRYDVQVVLPELRPDPDDSGKVFWESLALEVRKRVRDRASTLIFANSRRACEKLARLLNENQPELIAYSHHGSLSKEIRHDVETKLKNGELKALVATNSLELGIDIGDLDEVILAQTPRTAASAIQKVGRAGHRIHEVSRARLYPSHGLDLIEAAVIVRCIRDQTVEPIIVPEGPLDILAQSLLSILSARPSAAEDLYALVRCAWPYRNLGQRAFDLVLEMLAGRYAGTRIPELKPRIELDVATGAWTAKSSVPFLLYSSGGAIPDRGYFTMKDAHSGTALGELDEEFVWERTLGDRFALGAQVWKIAAINEQVVQVEPVDAPPHIIPFWKAEDQDRSWFLAEKIGLFLAEADAALSQDPEVWKTSLVKTEGFSTEAAERLVQTLERERQVIGALPHRWRLVIEQVGEDQYILHTFWGARSNRPWAFALAQAWEDRFGYALETYPGDDQILILAPPETDLREALSLVTPGNLESLLKKRLEATGYFGARFREGAGRALLFPKAGFAKRTPLWQTRMRSKRLFEAVSAFPEFPILLEAWRQCLHDDFELEALKARLEEINTGRIQLWQCRTSEPSPFTDGLLWRQISEKIYAQDDPPTRRASGLDQTLWDQLLGADRPRLPQTLIADWEARWARTAPGYAPETAADLADLLEVRIALSLIEWQNLLDACAQDSGLPPSHWKAAVAVVADAVKIGVPALAPLWSEPQALWLRWLEGRGPMTVEGMASFWGQDSSEILNWAHGQVEAGLVVLGLLTEGATVPELCLTRTWDQLVRRLRLDRRSTVALQAAEGLSLFLGRWQGLTRPEKDPGNLEARISPLLGLPVAAELWESALLPTRVSPYRSADWDRLFIECGLQWFGVAPGKVVLGFPEDRHTFLPADWSPQVGESLDRVFGRSPAPTQALFADLAQRSGLSTAALTEALWDLAWQGAASSTSFGPLRQGLRSGFRYESGTDRGFQRWSSTRSSAGTWQRWDSTPPPEKPGNDLDHMEDLKRRARLVLDRYGIVFRTLLAQEGPSYQWRLLFPALRLMELSGEIVGGLFWKGLSGLQFATPEALRQFEAGGEEGVFWVQHAQDPSSLCGLGLDAFPRLPRRTTGSWLWWQGSQLLGNLTAGGKKLELFPEFSEQAILPFVRRMAGLLLTDGKTHWALETIDGFPAAESPWTSSLVSAGFRVHGERLFFWKAP